MKKLLSKIDPVPSSGHSQGSCIGRSWTLPRHTVTVEEVIAEGGFGVVFLAKQGAQKFALKRVIVNDEQDLAVATREIQIMTSLGDHPNLLACLDYLVTPLGGGGVTELVGLMPYCRGSLLALLNARMSAKSHLSEKEVLQILADVVSGVARLHQCATPIVHRDLKVENVLEDDGKFLLCDFGSATPKFWDPAVHEKNLIAEDLEKYTTLAYRAPEMVDLYSNRGPISTKADIWAVGILLFKMCFYTTPFGDSLLAIQSAQVTFPASSPFSPHLHALIQYLLKSDSEKRPDIFQVGELCYSLLGLPNPITNVACAPPPPSLESLVAAMNTAAVAAKTKAEEKTKSTSVTPAPIVTAQPTSVTPRQRPKGNIVVPGPGTGSYQKSLLPPPKSPKPVDSHSHSQTQNQNPHVFINPNQPPSDHCHRRNASDSSAFDKNSLQNDLQSASSETQLSSWNPFAGDCFPPGGTTAATGVVTTTATTNIDTNVVEDDPFANAPFDYFKYRPMGVDLFGSAPFSPTSNPFLEFSTADKTEGVTNLSFEDER